MKKSIFIAATLAFVLLVACSTSKKEIGDVITGRKPDAIYKELCASCHGQQGESFRMRVFKYGAKNEEIHKSIKEGIVNAGMPAYGNTLNTDEIDQLTAYIKDLALLPKIEPNNKTIFNSEVVTLQLDTITTEASIPWSIEFLPDNTMLIADRDGDFYHRYNNGNLIKISNTPIVHNKGQGGLLDVLVHPDFKTNSIIYISYSKPLADSKSTTAVVMAKLTNDALTDVKEILEAKPYFTTNHHYGSRMVMDKNKFLFITVGERGKENENPQDLKSMCGKVHRLKEDGSIPNDNPYVGQSDIPQSIYSWGHRNPQAIDINPISGEVWANEHGPKGGDEINIVMPKRNFGWPIATYGINYNGTIITENKTGPGVTDPIHYWLPSIGPGDGIFVTSDIYGPKWKNNYISASLSFGYLERLVFDGSKVTHREKVMEGVGRMRSLKQGPDGFIYIGLENPGRVYRIRPLW
jgi:aldose sugar dehydrogenase